LLDFLGQIFEDTINLHFDIYLEKLQKNDLKFKNTLFTQIFIKDQHEFVMHLPDENLIDNFKVLNPDKNEFYIEFYVKKPALYDCSVFVNKKMLGKNFFVEIKGNKLTQIEDDLQTNSESLINTSSKILDSLNSTSFLKNKDFMKKMALQKNLIVHKNKKIIVKEKTNNPICPVKISKKSTVPQKPPSVKPKKNLNLYSKNKEILQQIFDKSKSTTFK
jgi:hypothetical protein